MINNKIIVYTAGTWDVFHVGHLNIIKKSKDLGDYLIVAVSTDDLVKSYKKYYPAISYKDRAKIVRACRYVDKIVKQTELINIKHLKRYKVDIVTIGSDWKGRNLKGLEWAKNHGIKVVYINYGRFMPSSEIRKRIKF